MRGRGAEPLVGFQGHKSLIYYSGLERGHETLCSRSAITREAPAGASPPMTISESKKRSRPEWTAVRKRFSSTVRCTAVLRSKTVLWRTASAVRPFLCIFRARRAKGFAGSARTRHLFEKGGRKLHFLTTAAIAGMKLYFLTMLSLAKYPRALSASGDSRLTWREFYLLLKPHRGRQTLFSHHAVTREAPVGASPPRSACACYAP